MEIVRIVESGGGKLHAQRTAKLIERKHVGRVVVAHRAAKTYILKAHLFEGEQSAQALIESAGMAAKLVILAAETLDGDTDTDIRKTLGQSYHSVFIPSAGRYDYALGVAIALLNYLGEIFADKWLSTCEIDKLQVGQSAQVGSLDLLTFIGWILPDVAHLASHRASVC